MSKEKFTVSWIMAEEPLLKLKEPDETYDIQENVFEFIKEKKLFEKEDFEVEVEIDKQKGENGTVIYLKEVGSTDKPKTTESNEEKKEEVKVETEENLTVKELTVAGVSVTNKGVTFKEEDKVWYTLDDSIDPQQFKDNYTKKTVEVSIKASEKGNNIVVAFTVKEEQVSEDESPKPNQDKRKATYNGSSPHSNATQISIESQASTNSANQVVQAMVTKDTPIETVKKLITDIAEHNFQTIQDLKNK